MTLRCRSHSRRPNGFTLIEILVVVVIIGIATSMVVLSLGVLGDDRQLRTEAQRMISLMDVARDESLLQGREFGIEFMTSSYRFVEYDAFTDQWSEIPGDDTLRLRTLPDDIELSLFLDDQRIQLKANPAKIKKIDDKDPDKAVDSARYAPHVFVGSGGELSAFKLQLTRSTDHRSVAIEGDVLGDIKFSADDDPTTSG